MPNPLLKGLQIIYSPDSVHIPKSSCLAAGAAEEFSSLGVWFRLSQALFSWVGFN